MKNSVQLPSKFRIKSEMMLEMEKIQPEIFHIEKPTEDAEEQPTLSREELIQRSRELRQLRMKESQRSIKAHHQNKIKSKKFHRILKKEKMKQQIKEFELLQKTDPEAALRKIEQLDRSRIEERGMLRHRNTGTWAKNLQVRAKYDKDARKDLAEQIAISREITAKKPIDESDDEEEETTANGDGDSDPFNPWLKADGKSNGGQTNEVSEFLSGYRKYWEERNEKQKELADYRAEEAQQQHDSDSEDTQEQTVVKRKSQAQVKSTARKMSKVNAGWIEEDNTDAVSATGSLKKKVKKAKTNKKGKTKEQTIDNIDDLFDDAEEVMRTKYEKKLKALKNELESGKKHRKNAKKCDDDDEASDEQIDLSFKKKINRPNIDEALNGDDGDETLLSKQIRQTQNPIKSNANGQTASYDSENINPNDIAKVKPQHLTTALPSTIYSVDDDGFNEYTDDYLFDEEKKLTIAEAFEDDDIVNEFKREKDDEAKKSDPQEIDMSMPGWGSWGGSGIDPTKQRTKRKMVLRKFKWHAMCK